MKKKLDEIDLKIINLYLSNPYLQQIEISSQIGLGKSAINSRIKKLKLLGLLLSPVVIDLSAIKNHRVDSILIDLEKGGSKEIASASKWLSQFDFVLEVKSLSGSAFDIIVDYIVDINNENDNISKRTKICDLPSLKSAKRIRSIDNLYKKSECEYFRYILNEIS